MRLDQLPISCFILSEKEKRKMNITVLIFTVGCMMGFGIWFLVEGISFRMACKKNGLKIKDSLGSRMAMAVLISFILVLLELIPYGLINLGQWMLDKVLNASPLQMYEDILDFIISISYGCIVLLGVVIILISALMAIIYAIIELYCIWYYFVQPQVVEKQTMEIKNEEEIKEVVEGGETWKEI